MASETTPNQAPEAALTVTLQNDGLVVQGQKVTEAGDTKWLASSLDDKRILLVTDDAKLLQVKPAGVAACDVAVFKDFILGLYNAGWSGMVSVDTGYGVKRVYFSRGQIVFAASNIMDDRLGEVIYREAKITLDELTNSAAQVTKSRKFGQVLISSSIFSNVQLWQALKLQVKQILRSLFMVDRVYLEMQAGTGLAPTEVVFPETVTELVNESYSYGCAFREFLGKLRQESQVQLLGERDNIPSEFQPGTFVGDLLELIAAQGAVQDLLNASKLIDVYTVAALFHLVNLGLCRVTPEAEDVRRNSPDTAPLKAKIDAYEYVLQQVHRAFTEASKTFPVADCRAFASSLNPEGFPSLFIDSHAALSRDCVSGIYSQCAANVARVGYFVVRIESMIQFLLQVAGDNLEYKTASKIRQDYRSVAV